MAEGEEYSALQVAVINRRSRKVVMKLIEVGGRDLVMKKGFYGMTELHWACREDASIDVVSKLIEVGGRELVMQQCDDGCTSIFAACRGGTASMQVISKLIEIAGTEILFQENDIGDFALYEFFFQTDGEIFGDTFTFVLKEYISAQIGGEFAIGGLFDTIQDGEIQKLFYNLIYLIISFRLTCKFLKMYCFKRSSKTLSRKMTTN